MIISALRGIFLGLSNLVDLLANGGYCPSLSSPQTGTPRAYQSSTGRDGESSPAKPEVQRIKDFPLHGRPLLVTSLRRSDRILDQSS